MAVANPMELLADAFRQIAQEVVFVIPKIFGVLVILAITLVVIKVLNISLKKVLGFVEVDEMVKKLAGFSLPFSISNFLIFLADLGVVLISLYTIFTVFLEAQYLPLVTQAISYGARVISIVVIAIFLFSIFGVIISRIRVETRLRGYTLFIILLLVTAMLVDVTALSEPVKNALITGLSIGVGISVGVFAVWFFFHDYLDEMFLRKETRKPKREAESD